MPPGPRLSFASSIGIERAQTGVSRGEIALARHAALTLLDVINAVREDSRSNEEAARVVAPVLSASRVRLRAPARIATQAVL
jgi:hypothetical protein